MQDKFQRFRTTYREKPVVVNNYGISFCGLLLIVFITLKLTGQITWSWLWVLSPFWIPLIILLLLLFLIVILESLARALDR